MAKEKEIPALVIAEHAVIYCDGGYLLDRRLGGWGVHGYTYIKEEPKRGTGNPKVVPTDTGYHFEGVGGSKVTVVEYIDMAGGSRKMGSNNEAELYALVHALQWIDDNPNIKDVKIFSDSKFTVIGATQWLDKWIARKWVSSNGEPVKYRPTWERVKELMDRVKAKLDHFSLEWVKGHSGHPGNERSDLLASRGLIMADKDDEEHFHEKREAQGYWNVKNDIPRILQAPRWYFYTRDLDYQNDDGSYTYYVGTHGTKDKEDDLPGKRYADNFLGVVRVIEPNVVMETIRKSCIDMDRQRLGSIIVAHLDAIFSPKTYWELNTYGTRFLRGARNRIDLFDAKKNPIVVEQKPLGLGFRKADIWRSLQKTLDSVISKDPYFRLTEITDLLYEGPDPKKGTRKLKAGITQVTKFMDFMAEFNLEKESDEPKPFEAKIRLILGSDILTRNQLAALSDDIESLHIVTWRESDLVGRYATLVRLKSGDVGLWARYESNVFFNKSQTAK